MLESYCSILDTILDFRDLDIVNTLAVDVIDVVERVHLVLRLQMVMQAILASLASLLVN